MANVEIDGVNSVVYTDQVDPKTGTTLTLGTSGDTVSIPSGVTITNSGTNGGGFGTTLTGSTNNQVTTVTGANAITGESDLTFDPSTNTLHVGADDNGIITTSYALNLKAPASEPLNLWSNNTQNLTVKADDDVEINTGDIIFGAAGKGICLGVTSNTDSNTLDDYEEGICVVTFATQGGSITINTGYDTMQYTKIGRLVHIQGHIQVSSVSSPTGWVRITALPFTSTSGTEYSGTASSGVYHGDLNATSGTNVLWYIPPSSANMVFYDQNTTAPEDMADHFKAGSYLIVSAVYEV